METNEHYKLGQDWEAPFMTPSILRFLPWNWWQDNPSLINYYKNDITFHGPDVYLSGTSHSPSSPYPLLRASNFDSIDFEHALSKMTVYLTESNNSDRVCHLLTDIVSDTITEELHNHNNNLMHDRNRRSYSMHHHQHTAVDDELVDDINRLQIKMSVSGTFIAKPYDQKSYNAQDKSFDVRLHFNWNIDCIESDCAYSVYILPSHRMNRQKSKEIAVYSDTYHSLNGTEEVHQNNGHNLRIYPQEKERMSRKRNRSQIESYDSQMLQAKRRKLNETSEKKQELEHKEDTSLQHRPIQKRFKQKSSNRKVHRSKHQDVSVERLGNRRISMTASKKKTKRNRNTQQKKKERVDDDDNRKYRGYFIAIFVPRSAELYPFCTESMNLQPFIRGQIVFYDAIDADQDKPNKHDYEWMIGQIIETYKCKGSNLEELKLMEFEAQQLEEYQAIKRRNYNKRQQHNQSTESVVFGGGGSSKQEMDDGDEEELTQQTSALSMGQLQQQQQQRNENNNSNHNHSNEPSSVSPQAGNCDTINLTV